MSYYYAEPITTNIFGFGLLRVFFGKIIKKTDALFFYFYQRNHLLQRCHYCAKSKFTFNLSKLSP